MLTNINYPQEKELSSNSNNILIEMRENYMNILILGAAGFIGTNLTIQLAKSSKNKIRLVDKNLSYFKHIEKMGFTNIEMIKSNLDEKTNFNTLLQKQDIVYHLISTTVPTTSNQYISLELQSNIILSSILFESCVKCGVKKVVFISSGGTVYGKEVNCPLSEDTPTNPITSYGVQKITIEKLLYLYRYMYGLDYRIIRLANPYGPFQQPNGILGAVTTFTYKVLKREDIEVYGDGSVIRDFIYIDDVIRGILNIVNGEAEKKTFNLGCGYGTSIKELIEKVQKVIGCNCNIIYKEGRKVDVPVNYLDITRYEKNYGKLNPINLEEGIQKTADFMRILYGLK